MDIFDFITQDEIDDLPEDSALAFMTFVRHAQRRLSDYIRELNSSQEDEWRDIEEARYCFQNVTLAAAKRFGIEPFVSFSMPSRIQYNKNNNDYQQYKADLDHYMTQLLLDSSIRSKRDSILVMPPAKERIRSYIHGLKVAIDQSDFSESKRAVLLEKLAEFETELDKRRLNLLAVTRLVIEILAIPGTLWASYEIVSKLTNNILQVVGEAKAVDDDNRRLPPVEMPSALLPPRKKEDTGDSAYGGGSSGRSSGSGDLDDDIPF